MGLRLVRRRPAPLAWAAGAWAVPAGAARPVRRRGDSRARRGVAAGPPPALVPPGRPGLLALPPRPAAGPAAPPGAAPPAAGRRAMRPVPLDAALPSRAR